jgi:N utilization substance protein B
MNRRSRAREVALQLLFQRDINSRVPDPVIERFIRDRLRDPKAETFARGLYDRIIAETTAIDKELTLAADNWRIARMSVIDRNVLRIGAYEILFPTKDSPAPVVINEAIELARRYGAKDSPGFVNGILDKILQMHPAKPEPEEDPPIESRM